MDFVLTGQMEQDEVIMELGTDYRGANRWTPAMEPGQTGGGAIRDARPSVLPS